MTLRSGSFRYTQLRKLSNHICYYRMSGGAGSRCSDPDDVGAVLPGLIDEVGPFLHQLLPERQRIPAPVGRIRTRRAVSCCSCQMGCSTQTTMSGLMVFIGRLPIMGCAWVASVFSLCRRCFAL